MTDLSGHVGLVTGGNSGIGLGMASGLARAGASVAIWGTNPDKNAAAGEQLAAIGGGKVHVEQCDVSDEAQIVESFAATVDALGQVDSVFANAGVSGSGAGVLDMTLEEWRRVMAVNLDGAFLTMREGARHMVARGGGGAIVAVSSVSAIHGAPNGANYAAAKTAPARADPRDGGRPGPLRHPRATRCCPAGPTPTSPPAARRTRSS